MTCSCICWAALAALIGGVMVGLGFLLYPRGDKGRDLSRELTREIDEWRNPSQHRKQTPASPTGPNP